MDYAYPAGKGAAPWNTGWPQGPAAAPAGMNPWADSRAGKYAAPWGAAPAGKYAAPWNAGKAEPYAPWTRAPGEAYAPRTTAPAVQYGAPWSARPGAYADPPGAMLPQRAYPGAMPSAGAPMYMNEMFPSAQGFQKGQAGGPMAADLASMIVPALNSVIPAIRGLLQIPSLLMEYGDSADLLSQWANVQVFLMPTEEMNPNQMTATANAGETLTASDLGDMTAAADPGEIDLPGDESPQA